MEVDFNVLKGDIDTAEVETVSSREYGEIWYRRWCYRDTYIRGGDIIHTRYAFIKKPRARVERCDRGLRSDPLHSNPRGNLLPGLPVSESAISDPFYQLTARIRYEDPSLRDSSTFSVLALLRFFLSRRFLPLLCLNDSSFLRPPRSFLRSTLDYFFLLPFSFYDLT